MITVIPYDKLGQADYEWLQARYHFSFARYRNPERTGFGKLRVVNDDIVKAGFGFEPHGHKDMEIITYVRKGAITHTDSLGHSGRTKAGDIQVMSAGAGIEHSEYNNEDVDTSLYQIWITPREKDIEPRWEAAEFPQEPVSDTLSVLASGEEGRDGALYIHADATIFGGRLQPGATISQPLKHQGYLLVSGGTVKLGDHVLHKGDAAEITDSDEVTLQAEEGEAEVLLIDVAAD